MNSATAWFLILMFGKSAITIGFHTERECRKHLALTQATGEVEGNLILICRKAMENKRGKK